MQQEGLKVRPVRKHRTGLKQKLNLKKPSGRKSYIGQMDMEADASTQPPGTEGAKTDDRHSGKQSPVEETSQHFKNDCVKIGRRSSTERRMGEKGFSKPSDPGSANVDQNACYESLVSK